MPTRFIVVAVAVLLVLGLGGAALERVIGNPGGVASTAGTTPTVATTLPAIGARSVIGLTRLTGAPAPGIDLTSSTGQPWSLTDVRGQVVIVGFLNASCDDICPVLTAEIRDALTQLGPLSARVDVVLINTDPFHLRVPTSPPALRDFGTAALGHITFLTGTLAQLTRVWSAYGVQVRVDAATRRTVHNDVLYVVDPGGDLRFRALPSANETPSGRYQLDAVTEHLAAQALAAATGSLAR